MNQTASSDINATLIEHLFSDSFLLDDNSTFLNDSTNGNDSEYYYENAPIGNDYIFRDMPDILRRYDDFHYSIHGYLTLAIIILGTIGNIISMVVFTRKNMITSINIILTALSFADMMVLVTYLVKIKYHTNVVFLSYTEYTYPLAVFSMYLKHTFILAHTVSVWLTVVVAIWRVMGVCYSMTTTRLRSPFRAKIAVACTYLGGILVCIPEFLRKDIETYYDDDGNEKYRLTDSEIYTSNLSLFDFIDDWVFNIVLYLVSCIPLTIFTLILLRKITRAKKKREKLNAQCAKQDLANDRLTKILIIILTVFLVVKIPPGIMYVLEFCLGYKIVHQIHFVFAGTINFGILFNSAINFFVYFFMSTQFRATAHSVFCKSVAKKVRQTMRRRPLPKPENQNGSVNAQ